MSQSYNGRDMDRPSQPPASGRRPRERMQPGQPRDDRQPVYQPQVTQDPRGGYGAASQRLVPPQGAAGPRSMRQQKAPPARDGKVGKAPPRQTPVIPRQAPAPQWPLPAPPAPSPEPGRPPSRPQRPPRPSHIPLLVTQSPPQAPTPSSRAPPSVSDSPHESSQGYSSLPLSYPGPGQTPSFVGSTPEPPAAVAISSSGSLRRSANLGPPPTSRRGQSSLYSTAAFVSPIPEEGLGARSHASYASSGAMPDNWRAGSMCISPGYTERFYEESLTDRSEQSATDEYGDESNLVRGNTHEKGTALTLIVFPPDMEPDENLAPSPTSAFDKETGFMDASPDSSNASFTNRQTPATTPGTARNLTPTPVAMLNPRDTVELRKSAGSPQLASRLSAIRRPPRLDLDAVKRAEARGSLTSLSDLIARATRLATMIDKGRRPASRMDELDLFKEKGGDIEKRSHMDDRDISGLSDMIGSFPSPAHIHHNNGHVSWPVVPGIRANSFTDVSDGSNPKGPTKKKGRRCCGLPVCGFILVILLMLCIVAAAVVIPLEFFVFKNLGNTGSSEMTIGDCQQSLTCLNGGTNVVLQNTCSCICTNGFTGANCNTGGSSGCTTTDLVATDGSSSINNVTLGNAIPRVIADSSTNFSIPLVGTTILAKVNSANLSCIAQNSLMTFDGQSTRMGAADAEVDGVIESTSTNPPATTSVISTSSTTPTPTAVFTVTEEVLDFARTVVLYVLQQESVDAAGAAQSKLQQVFSSAMDTTQGGNGVTVQQASSLNIGGNNTVNLVGGTVNVGQGAIGGTQTAKRDMALDSLGEDDSLLGVVKTGQPVFPRGLAACR